MLHIVYCNTLFCEKRARVRKITEVRSISASVGWRRCGPDMRGDATPPPKRESPHIDERCGANLSGAPRGRPLSTKASDPRLIQSDRNLAVCNRQDSSVRRTSLL